MEMDCSLNPDPKLARAFSALTDRTRGVPTTEGATTRQPPQSPSFELTDAPRYDSFSRQCTLVGDSLNDKKWSDDLFNPSSYQKIRKPARRP